MNVENLEPHMRQIDAILKNDKSIESFSLYLVINSENKTAICSSGFNSFNDECSHVKQIELYLIKKSLEQNTDKQPL